jgi:uncharacterized protein (TIGR02284 family)
MQHSNEHAVEVLNGLIKTTLDSVGGYRDAAESVDDTQCKTLFRDRASMRQQLASKLQQEVRMLGGEPQTDQGVVGKMHNKFVELKSAVTGSSDKAVVDEVERGEDHIKERFEDALEDGELPASVRTTVGSAYQSIKADHDEISRIKHTLH